ncbi:hypothetical protein KOW79_000105 [Hemibagrus wyckioides]|uniref:Uncharacterized protein n=1 Tax=Hemibagrus wyckioides TaxID=337641 RepID=A0A9D3N2N6_9TELE|nr:hypothetical protein KOW79_000105 [Hemibagrus wyckioides]
MMNFEGGAEPQHPDVDPEPGWSGLYDPWNEPVDVLEESADTPSVLQVFEPNLQLLPTEPHEEPSAVILPLDADEPDSACRDVQCVSVVSSLSQWT